MKFVQLAYGATFEFRGVRYRKISSLEGIEETSGQRKLIPRSATVNAVDGTKGVDDDGMSETIRRADPEAVLIAFADGLRQQVCDGQLGHDPGRAAAFDKLLAQAQRELRAVLKVQAADGQQRPADQQDHSNKET